MVSTGGNRYRLFLIICMGFMSQWSGNGLISYSLSRGIDTVGIKNQKTQALVNGLVNIWGWAIALTSAFFVERFGRRLLFRTSALGMLAVFTAWTIASVQFAQTQASASGIAVMVLIFVYEFFYCIAFSPLPVAYSVEVLPFPPAPMYVNPIGLQNIGWRFYIVYVAIPAAESFIAYGWFLETKGKTLDEVAVPFDGEQADVRVEAEAAKTGKPIVEEAEDVYRKV